MKLGKCIGIMLALACLQNISAQMPDTLWMCRDSINPDELFYFHIGLCDTPVGQFRCANDSGVPSPLSFADTGDKWDKKYINFNYQFTDAKPGYSGFKIFWDNGLVSYDASTYNSVYFVYKGPLPGHKVHLVWAQGGECGGPINYQDFGDFKASATWKKIAIPFPKKRGDPLQNPYPDSPFVKKGLFELRVLIYDDSSVTTSPTSGPGDLKLDDIGFINQSSAVRDPVQAQKIIGNSRCFMPTVSGKVTLAVYSLQGEELYKGRVDVAAGKSYNLVQFARTNSRLAAGSIHCIQISGSGVNITGMVHQ